MQGEPPPPGHAFWYKTEVKLENGYEVTFDLTMPKALQKLDLSTVRVGRHGGSSESDVRFRDELYRRIGAVTAVGGHAETAMKRLLIILKGGTGQFSHVDKTWSDLHKALLNECSNFQGDLRRQNLKPVLEWGDKNRVKTRRDNAVHAYWWIYDGCGVTRSRFFRHQDGATIVSSLEDLDEDAQILFDYAQRLDRLLEENWPRAMLPRVADLPTNQSTD